MSEAEIIRTFAVYLIPVLFAISLHEAAHGYVARHFGDPTAFEEGRLSLNPLRHIDPFGTVLLPLLLAAFHLPPFGYARPVPVDFDRLRNPRRHMAYVAAAGPAANFAMGLGWMVLLLGLSRLGADDFFMKMTQAGVAVNAAMCVFNLIPIPPLDGGRIVVSLLPARLGRSFGSLERYGLLVFIGLIALMKTGVLQGPLLIGMEYVQALLYKLVSPLISLLFT